MITTQGLSWHFSLFFIFFNAYMHECAYMCESEGADRNRSSSAIICHFNEKRTGCMWCVDDILWPNVDKSATSTVILLKQWRVASIEIDLGKRESVLLFFFFVLSPLEWFNNPSFYAYVMSGEKRKDKAKTKQSQKVKSRPSNFGVMGSFPYLTPICRDVNVVKGVKKHTCSLQDAVSPQWRPHITVYKRLNQKAKHLTTDSTRASEPWEAAVTESHCSRFHKTSHMWAPWTYRVFIFNPTFLTLISTSHSPRIRLNDFLQHHLRKRPWVESQIKPISHLLLPFAPTPEPVNVCTE